MKKLFLVLGIQILGVLVSCTSSSQTKNDGEVKTSAYSIVGYVAGQKDLDIAQIQAKKLTHINYAFANVVDGLVTEGEGRYENDSTKLNQLRRLKNINPQLKILISIGGWTWSGGFSDAVLDDVGRKKFTASAIDYLIRHDLDGLDFDWEYPGLPGNDNTYRPEDKENFVLMLKSVRLALDSLGDLRDKYYLSTIASGGFQDYLDVNDLAEGQKYLDFINIMAYDFIGEWSDTTGHHTNLYTNQPGGRSAENAVLQHVEAGIPIGKLVLGMGFYGRSWENVNAENSGLYQKGEGWKGIPFEEINILLKHSEYISKWDDVAKAPYLWNPEKRIFITYEDQRSILEKAKFIKEKGLGGAMFWEYSEDTDEGDLLNAIYSGLY